MKIQFQLFIVLSLYLGLQFCFSLQLPKFKGIKKNENHFQLQDSSTFFFMKLPWSFSEATHPSFMNRKTDVDALLETLKKNIWKLDQHGSLLRAQLHTFLKDIVDENVSKNLEFPSDSLSPIASVFTVFVALQEQMDKEIRAIQMQLLMDMKTAFEIDVKEPKALEKGRALYFKDNLIGFQRYKLKKKVMSSKTLTQNFVQSKKYTTLVSQLETIYTNRLAFEFLRKFYYMSKLGIYKEEIQAEKVEKRKTAYNTFKNKLFSFKSGKTPSQIQEVLPPNSDTENPLSNKESLLETAF